MMGKGVTRYEKIYRGLKRPHDSEAQEEYFQILQHSLCGSTTVVHVFGRKLAECITNYLNHDLEYGAALDRNLARDQAVMPPVLPRNLRTVKSSRNGLRE